MDTCLSDVVTRWFTLHRGSLELPDGWFGRPYDNRHEMTSVHEGEGMLSLVLDNTKVKLFFVGLEAVYVEGNDLVFGPFQRLDVRCQQYENEGVLCERTYERGIVRFYG